MVKKRGRLILIVLAAGLGYYLFVRLTGWGIPCPVELLSGGHIHCPGCGVSHVCMSLARLDFADAFYWNPAILCLMPFWAVGIGLWLFDKGQMYRKIVVWGSVVLMVSYGIIRNIPGWPLY